MLGLLEVSLLQPQLGFLEVSRCHSQPLRGFLEGRLLRSQPLFGFLEFSLCHSSPRMGMSEFSHWTHRGMPFCVMVRKLLRVFRFQALQRCLEVSRVQVPLLR